MKALRLPACASPVAYLFRFRGPRDPPLFVLALAALPDGWRTHPGQGIWSAGRPFAGTLSLGRRRDLAGSQAIHPMPLPRSKTPAGPTIPHPDGVVGAAPAQPTAKAPAIIISRLLTRLRHLLPTLTTGVAARHARLASGWLADLYREGVEPSGSRQKVSELHVHPPLLSFPCRKGRLRQEAVRRTEGRPRLSRPLHPSRRHLEFASDPARRGGRHLQVEGLPDQRP